jgi:hypothetical protein
MDVTISDHRLEQSIEAANTGTLALATATTETAIAHTTTNQASELEVCPEEMKTMIVQYLETQDPKGVFALGLTRENLHSWVQINVKTNIMNPGNVVSSCIQCQWNQTDTIHWLQRMKAVQTWCQDQAGIVADEYLSDKLDWYLSPVRKFQYHGSGDEWEVLAALIGKDVMAALNLETTENNESAIEPWTGTDQIVDEDHQEV